MPDVNEPIIVPASPLMPVATALLRHILTIVGTSLVAHGWIDQDTASQGIELTFGLALAIVPSLWAIVRAKLTHDKLVTVTNAAPDSVGKVV